MYRKKPIIISTLICACSLLLAITLPSPVYAKWITTEKVIERSTQGIRDCATWEQAKNLFDTSYFKENGFHFRNNGELTLELDAPPYRSFSGYNPDVVGTVDAPDGSAIKMRCAEVNTLGEVISTGGILGKAGFTFSKIYPTFVALPDETYFYNITIKLAQTEKVYTREDADYRYYAMYFPAMMINFVGGDTDSIFEAIEQNDTNLINLKGFSIAFYRGCENEEVDNLNDPRLYRHNIGFSEWSLYLGNITEVSYRYSLQGIISDVCWIFLSMSFAQKPDGWYIKLFIQNKYNAVETISYEFKLTILTQENVMNILNYFMNTFIKVPDCKEKKDTGHFWVGIIIGILLVIGGVLLCMTGVGAPIGIFMVKYGIGIFLICLATYLIVWSYSQPSSIMSITNYIHALFAGGRALVQNVIDWFVGKPDPSRNIFNYIDDLTIDWGNNPPISAFSDRIIWDHFNITQEPWIYRKYPIIAYDTIEYYDFANSYDIDGWILETRFYGAYADIEVLGNLTTHHWINDTTPETLNYTLTSVWINPAVYANITLCTNYTYKNITYDRFIIVRGVKTECLGITFDNKNASAWSEITRKHEFDTAYIHPDPTIGNPVEQILDSNMSGMDLIDVYWQKLIARIHPKGDVWHPIGEPIMFDACYCVKRYNWGDPKTFITAQDIEQRGISYHWDFGDGTTEVTYTPYVNHTFTTKGNFTVVLTIRDLEGNEDCDFTVIHTYTVIPFPEEIVVGILGALAQAWWLWLFLIFAIPIGLAGTYYYKKKREGEI